MDVYFYEDPDFNFGDDLNRIVWPKVMPKAVWESERILLIGIGSILTDFSVRRVSASPKTPVVVGSGLSYGEAPEDVSKLRVLAVRGPLTARVIQQPEAAVTDSAILLAAAGDAMPKADGPRDKVLYMPHHKSLIHGNDLWRRAAEEAGLTFVTPRQDVTEVLKHFARAKLVVTEAMHGAIVADTLRIPWVPVAASPAFDVFKWRDWTLSMETPLEVVALPPSSVAEGDRWARMEKQTPGRRKGDPREVTGNESRDVLIEHLRERHGVIAPPEVWRQDPVSRAVRLARRALNPGMVSRVAKILGAQAQRPGFLSDDAVFRRRLDQMLAAVEATRAYA